MKALSLSVSSPSRGKGNLRRSPVTASTMSACSRSGRATHSVQPDATSVNTRVCTKLPSALVPQCTTMSGSGNPGWTESTRSEFRSLDDSKQVSGDIDGTEDDLLLLGSFFQDCSIQLVAVPFASLVLYAVEFRCT